MHYVLMLRGMPRMEVIPVLTELLELTGESQARLGERIGVSQATIHRWLQGTHEPGKSQWDVILDLYFSLKGWHSIDDKIAPFDAGFQQDVRAVVDVMIRREGPPRRR